MKRLLFSFVIASCSGAPKTGAPKTGAIDKAPPAPSLPAYTAYVRGALAEADLVKAKTAHDGLVSASADAAKGAGDVGHLVMLGTGESAAGPVTKDAFMAIDQWTSLDGARKVYGNPQFQAGFAALFAEPVKPELYRRRPDWHTWGDLSTLPSGDYYVMIVRGHLAKATDEENRKAHDAVAAGFEAAARKAGDFAHVPHVGLEDPRLFFNVDMSTSHEGMIAVLSNPQFQQAFGALFDAPPDVRIYHSTDWKQW